jgi:hypothetical protein
MKSSIIYIRIAGSICFLFLVFHFFFNRLFNWDVSLACLSQSDRAILLTYHYVSILITGFMTVVSLFQTRSLIESRAGKNTLLLFVAFYTIRIVTEFTLFGIEGMRSSVILIMCLIPVVLFTIPVLRKN